MATDNPYLDSRLPISEVSEVRPFCDGYMLGSGDFCAGWGRGPAFGPERRLMECLLTFALEYCPSRDRRLQTVVMLLGLFDGWRGRRSGARTTIECVFDELSTGMRRVARDGGLRDVPSPLRRRSDGKMPYRNVRADGSRGWAPGDDRSLDLWCGFVATEGANAETVARRLSRRIRRVAASDPEAEGARAFRRGVASAACALEVADGGRDAVRGALLSVGIRDPIDLFDYSGAAPGAAELSGRLWGAGG